MPKPYSAISMAVFLALSPPVSLACGNSTDPQQVVQAQDNAYNAHDLDAFAACYADDITIIDLAGKQPTLHGIPALKKEYGFLTKVPKAFRVEIVKRIASGPVVVDHERVLGLPADKGKPESVVVYEVRNGKIANLWFPPAR